MKAWILPSGKRIEAFGDLSAESLVLNKPLRRTIEEALRAAGLELADAPPASEPYLLISDRTFVTAGALSRFLGAAKAPARMKVDQPTWLEVTAPLQALEAAGVYEVGLLPAGAAPSFAGLPEVVVDLEIKEVPPPRDFVPHFENMPKAIPLTACAVHQIDHWTHVLRVNWLALAALWLERGKSFKASGLIGKALRLLKLFLRARSMNRFRIAAALSRTGRRCKIHPTAVVEASVLGDDVEVGPFALVRGSVLGDGVKVGEHAMVAYSVVGDRVRVGRLASANLCVVYPGGAFSMANGYQASVFGRDAFLAGAITLYDLSFGGPVKVTEGGKRVSSGTWFLGACVGHRARIGAQVVLGYGAEIPNEAVLVGPVAEVLRGWEPGPGPHRVIDGVARPIKEDARKPDPSRSPDAR